MVQFFLLVDGGCGACVEIGADLSSLPQLQVVSGSDAARWGLADYWDGSAPTLVRRQPNGPDRTWQGWGLRWQMAQMLGVRRWREWPSMLQRETSARRDRGLHISRRDALLGLAAGAVAAVVGSQPALASSPRQRPTVLGRADLDAVIRRSASARAAVTSFGRVDKAYRITLADESMTGLVHGGPDGSATLTLVPDDSASDQAAMSLVFSRRNPVFHYSRPNGEVVAANNFRSGAITAASPTLERHANLVHPDSASSRVKCFVATVGARTTKCKDHCSNCGYDIVVNDPLDFLTTLAIDSECWACIACAGGSAVAAAKTCFF
ncbi:hypothetical protein GCM10022197_13990 [Microlunatus spumicola]|uniref:Tat (Twin-arginine translocation) pathway signal sequence n=1 Tax=Microlunatus spumicola TaxID=81499 RepID=A0ABP6X2E4_9ACTN